MPQDGLKEIAATMTIHELPESYNRWRKSRS
jgi:hypothetical protein